MLSCFLLGQTIQPTDWIDRLSGKVIRDEDQPGRPIIAVDLSHSTVTDADLKRLARFTELQSLELSFTDVTDEGLEHLRVLVNLEHLDLTNTDTTYAGLKHLKQLVMLQNLVLSDQEADGLTDAGLEDLKALTRLRCLDLGFGLTDRALKMLREIDMLHVLAQATTADGKRPKRQEEVQSMLLFCPKLTGVGLKELAGLRNLQTLALVDAKITDDDLDELRKSLPNCRIVRGP